MRAWTIPRHTKAPQAAGKIHTDMERGFIKAEVYLYDDIVEHKTEGAVKAAGKSSHAGWRTSTTPWTAGAGYGIQLDMSYLL